MTAPVSEQPTADTSDVADVPNELPIYDPAAHDEQPDLMVLVVLHSTSGRTLRQADPVAYVRRSVREFVQRETAAGHGPASRDDALEEAERRRHASHIVEGREDEFVPAEFDARPGDDVVTAWPDVTEEV